MIVRKPDNAAARKLLHEGALVLSRMEQNGIRVDEEYFQRVNKKLERDIKKIHAYFNQSEEVKLWRRIYGENTNFQSGPQLSKILYEHLGYTTDRYTATGKKSTDEDALKSIDSEFVRKLLEYRGKKKAKNTYVANFIKETVNGYMYPFYSLDLVKTFRSSSSKPNFQNIPIRDPLYERLLRRGFISRKNHRLTEIDFSGLEVRVSACYHKDPTMLTYLRDKTTDMHRDMAMECFLISKNTWNSSEPKRMKQIRYVTKNRFVFPEFFGSYYEHVAPNMWSAITEFDLRTDDTTDLFAHLKQQGIKSFAQFKKHIQFVEEDFWNKRFRVYKQWKKDIYNYYLKKGKIYSFTGFTFSGYMQRNDVVNYPIQSAAFHMNLRALIEIQKEIDKKGMQTKLLGQIHDSVLADVPVEEFDDFVVMVKRIMEKRIPELFSWIIVPIEVEVEASPVNGNWYEKRPVA
jgi:DNA polymerase-1